MEYCPFRLRSRTPERVRGHDVSRRGGLAVPTRAHDVSRPLPDARHTDLFSRTAHARQSVSPIRPTPTPILAGLHNQRTACIIYRSLILISTVLSTWSEKHGFNYAPLRASLAGQCGGAQSSLAMLGGQRCWLGGEESLLTGSDIFRSLQQRPV